jgi:predicted DNA-binding protein (MmcQ/YjbR family)
VYASRAGSQLFLAAALPPLRPAAFFCAVVPPCRALPPEPDFWPPRLDAPGELAIFAAQNGQNGVVRAATIERRITELALSFPEAYEDRPWGDFPVFKVGQNKVFGWAVVRDGAVDVTVKLTQEEREIAHLLPYVRIASHVGRYGWITANVTDEESLEAALEWLRESYWLKCPAELKAAVEGED